MKHMGSRSVAYVLGRFPVLSERFIVREIEALLAQGWDIRILSLNHGDDLAGCEARPELRKLVTYAPTGFAQVRVIATSLLKRPAEVFAAIAAVLRANTWHLAELLACLRNVPACLFFGRQLAMRRVGRIHAHFAHFPTTAAMVISRLTGIPFSFSIHAYDLFVRPIGLAKKLRHAQFAVTCSDYSLQYVMDLSCGGTDGKVRRVYHGVDLKAYRFREGDRVGNTVLAVGRLVEKKGFRYLLEAARILLDRGRKVRIAIVGEGPLKEALRELKGKLHLSGDVTINGSVSPGDLLGIYKEAAVLVVPSVIASSGDRDGIPNVILEALAVGTPVIASEVSGIPEAIVGEETGLLVPPASPSAIADAVERILDDRALRTKIRQQGRRLAESKFSLEKNTRVLSQRFARNA